MAALVRETLERLAEVKSSKVKPLAAVSADEHASTAVTNPTSHVPTRAGHTASLLAPLLRTPDGAGDGAGDAVDGTVDEAAESTAELHLLAAEEEEALEAILGSEFTRAPGGTIELTLLWDGSTGDAPWAYSAALMAEGESADSRHDPSSAPPPTLRPRNGADGPCERCVIPGCRQPTNRHRSSAYCNATHAALDEARGGQHARHAGYAPSGGASSTT